METQETFCDETDQVYEQDKLIKHRFISMSETLAESFFHGKMRFFVCCKNCSEFFEENHLPKLKTIIKMHDEHILPDLIEYRCANECPLLARKEICGKVIHSMYFNEFRPKGQKKGHLCDKGTTICCYDWIRGVDFHSQKISEKSE